MLTTNKPLLFDGAMGTYLAAKGAASTQCELLNLTDPARVLAVHGEYIAAGAQAIKTNTFGANTQALAMPLAEVLPVIRAGWDLAVQAAQGTAVHVYADIGPMPHAPEDEHEWERIADAFLERGARRFLFETFADADDIIKTARYIKSKYPSAHIIASFAVTPDGYTRQGTAASALLHRVDAEPAIDVMGFNCVSGPQHLLEVLQSLPAWHKPVSVMPNAGYPSVVGSRTYFEADPAYFARQIVRMVQCGARVLGGCCGTTPEHIRRSAQMLLELPEAGARQPAPQKGRPAPAAARQAPPMPNLFAQKLLAGERVIAVELGAPRDAQVDRFFANADRMRQAGADILTIADCPVGRARVDSSMLAARVQRECAINAMPHLACRDRNINATKALLLGLAMEGVRSLMLITGDPVPQADREEVKAVFNFNSVMLTAYVAQLNQTLFTQTHGDPGFLLCAALNVNAPNFDAELKKAARKVQSGTQAFFTQPIFSDRALANLQRARQRLGAPLLGGVMPLVSHRNALFVQNEVSGIHVPQRIVQRFEGLDKAQCMQLSRKIALDVTRRMAEAVSGYYIVMPMRGAGVVEYIIRKIREEHL